MTPSPRGTPCTRQPTAVCFPDPVLPPTSHCLPLSCEFAKVNSRDRVPAPCNRAPPEHQTHSCPLSCPSLSGGQPKWSLASAPPSCRTWSEASPLPSACDVVARRGKGQGMGKISRSPTARVQIPSCACELRGPGQSCQQLVASNQPQVHPQPSTQAVKTIVMETALWVKCPEWARPRTRLSSQNLRWSLHTSSGGYNHHPTRQRRGLEQSRL